MRVIKIDDNNAIIVKGWWFWKRQAEIYKEYEYQGSAGWKYKLTGGWVMLEYDKAVRKAYGYQKHTRPSITGNPWVPVPKESKPAKNTTLPVAKLLTSDRK